jgi:1-acyl-sn-glycerol-3-phosphate acyltransferase
LAHFQRLNGPAVFIGNHMSTLETFVLPGLLLLFREVTFVLKESLMHYPSLGDILRRLHAISVTRRDPRADLKTVLTEGREHLAAGRSIVIFPQSTRAVEFDPERFNTLGVKLAARSDVPVIPFAVQTQLWGNGALVKDFGPVDLACPVRFEFGAPITVSGKGREAHQQVILFVQTQLARWESGDAAS